MYISRKAYTVELILLGVLLCVGGCISASKPQLNVQTQAEALSRFSLGLLAAGGNDATGAYDHFQTALRLDPDAKELYAPAVATALELGKKDEALRLAKKQIQLHPDTLAPQLLLAKVYALTDQLDLAEDLFTKLQSEFPSDPDIPIFLTRIYLSQNQRSNAIQTLRTAVENQTQNHELLLLLGALCIGNAPTATNETQAEEALLEGIYFLEKSLELVPENPAGWQQLGLAFIAVKQPEKALAAFQKALDYTPEDLSLARHILDLLIHAEKYDEAISACEQLAEKTKTEPEIWFQYLANTLPKKEIERLIHYLELQIDKHPQPSAPYSVLIAQLCLSTDQNEKAETVILQALGTYPEDNNLRTLMGYLRMKQDRYNEAFNEFERIHSLAAEDNRPDTPFFLYNFLIAAQKSGHMESAVKTLAVAHTNYPSVLNQYVRSALISPSPVTVENGIELLTAFHSQYPGTEESFYYLMLLQAGQKQYIHALETAQQVETLALKNNNTNLLGQSFYYQYASLYERTGQLETAEKLFFRVIESGDSPLVAAAQNYLAYMWAERGEKLEPALMLIQKALAVDPENGAFVDTLGWIYYMQGRYGEALDELKKACEITGNDPSVLEHLGDTYLKLGQLDAALEQWKKALEADPESERLIERLKKHGTSD